MGKCMECKWFNQDKSFCRCFNPKQTDQSLVSYCYHSSSCDLYEKGPRPSDEEMEALGYRKMWSEFISASDGRDHGHHYWKLYTPMSKGYSGFSGQTGPENIVVNGCSGYKLAKPKRKIFKKVLMAVPDLLLWILYFIITYKERERYMMAKSRGYDCIGSKDDSYIIPGSATIYTYDINAKPTRRFLTWKEFWAARRY